MKSDSPMDNVMTICCGMALDDTLGKYGCPNCEGDYQAMPSIREMIREEAEKQNLTAYAISKLSGTRKEGRKEVPVVSIVHVQAYLNGEKDMTSERLDAIMKVLKLEVKRK